MKPIIETHPSLKDLFFPINNRDIGLIQKHTRDVAKIREAIINNIRPDIWTRDIIIKKLLKELNIGDE